MKSPKQRIVALAAVTMVICSGCGHTRINEHRTYMAVNGQTGDVSLFRVSVEGYSEMAEAKYQAGWKNSEAVDELFKDVAAPLGGTRDKEDELLQETQLKMIEDITKKLREAASDPAKGDEVKKYEDMLVQARSLIRRVRANETSEVPYAPAEKFVIVFSADPNRVFGELAGVVERQANEASILKTLGGIKGKQEERTYMANFLWSQILTNTAGLHVEGADAVAVKNAMANLETYNQRLRDFKEGLK